MHVLYASWGYTVHDRRFIAAYADAGHQVGHVRFDSERVFDARPLPDGAEVLPFERLEHGTPLEAAVPGFLAAMRDFGPDLVHAGPVPSVAWVAARAGATPLIAMSWGSDLLREIDRDPEAALRAAQALNAANAFQCDCEAVEQVAARRFGYSVERIVRFPWGIDTACFSPGPADPAIRARLGGPDDVIVLSNRTWDHVYGVDTALLAFARAHAANPRLRLALAGSGPLADMVTQTIADTGIADAVTLLGSIPNDDLVGVLRACDLYLSCSLSDGTSISLLEAMGCALPAVVSDIPGNREWIATGDGGAIAAPGDAAGFADALISLAGDIPARHAAAQRNRRIVCERAEWSRNVPALITAAEHLAAGYQL